MRWLHATAAVVGWCAMLAWVFGALGLVDFHVCLKAPAGECRKPPNVGAKLPHAEQPAPERGNACRVGST